MNEAFIKQKTILIVDSVLFLLCITGVYQISEKAKLPFDINPKISALIIRTEVNSPYYNLNNSELISIDSFIVNSPEEAELITDTKNIGDNVIITFKTNTSIEKAEVSLVNFYSVWYLLTISITSLLFFLTALFVIVRRPNDIAATIFHWASMGIACIIDLTWTNNNSSLLIPYYLSRIPFHFAYTLAPLLFVHFTFVFPTKRGKFYRYIVIAGYLLAITLGLINFISYNALILNITDEQLKSYITVFNWSRKFLIVCIVFSIANFIYSYFTEKEISSRKKLKWVLYGFIIGPLGFVILWVLPILIVDNPLVPEELILLLMCTVPISFTIAIFKYHLLDIDYLINRSVVYTVVISILIILYVSILSLIVSNFKISNQTTLSIMAAVVVAFILQPLKSGVQKYVDRVFFHVQYNFKEELSSFLTEIKQFSDADKLSDFLIEKIDSLMPVDKIGYCNFNNETKQITLLKHKEFDLIAGKSLFIKTEKLKNAFFRIAAEKNSVEAEAKISTIFQNTLLRWKISLVLPIISEEKQLYGVVLLGKKKSGVKFSIEDVAILKNIGQEAAAVIRRIKLHEQLILEKLEAEKLQELNRQKSIFVSSVSHDLKTPLTSIKLFVQKILDEEENLSQISRRNLQIIDGESDRLTRLINNVLDYAKIEKGLKTYSLSENHLNKIIEKVLYLMKYTLSINRFELNTELSEFDDLICADEDALIEAFQNIISNSIKYSSDVKELSIKTFFENGYAIVSFSDKGVGIEESEFEKVFEPFYQSSEGKNADSTGLGLTIVKHIIEAHKGKIAIHSSKNLGTELKIYLPLKAQYEEQR